MVAPFIFCPTKVQTLMEKFVADDENDDGELNRCSD